THPRLPNLIVFGEKLQVRLTKIRLLDNFSILDAPNGKNS
ncbi:unnamed protein product, partial [Allacma fusca]